MIKRKLHDSRDTRNSNEILLTSLPLTGRFHGTMVQF